MTESASIMRFKAQIRNYAKAYAVPAQTAMQNFMFEVDYDGWTISARQHGVSRNAQTMLKPTRKYNKPMENN